MAILDKIRLSGVTYDIVDSSAIHDLSDYSTTSQMNAAITAATSALAETIAEQGYQNAEQVATAVQNGVSGKADSTALTEVNNALTAHTANTDIHVTVNDKAAWNAKLDAADIEGLFGYSEYDSSTHRINFKNTSTGSVLSYIDASPFIVDGMVQNVEIKDVTIQGESVKCLVISFNTDAGKQDINIPISQVFDASNYYTKSQTDARIDEKIVEAGGVTAEVVQDMIDDSISGKADTTAVTQAISESISGKADDNAVVKNVSVNKDVQNKKIQIMQLKNGTNSQAGVVNLGNGLKLDTNGYAVVDTNAVAEKSYVDTGLAAKNQVITLDGTTLVIS